MCWIRILGETRFETEWQHMADISKHHIKVVKLKGGTNPHSNIIIIARLCWWVGFDMHVSGHCWPRPLPYPMETYVINITFHKTHKNKYKPLHAGGGVLWSTPHKRSTGFCVGCTGRSTLLNFNTLVGNRLPSL